jgi:inner membrane protein
MEPVTHFLTGACIGRAGLNRKTAYATLAAVLAAEAADMDILWSFAGPVEELKHHRGITHTFLAAPIVAGAAVGVVWLWNAWRERRRNKRAAVRGVPPIRQKLQEAGSSTPLRFAQNDRTGHGASTQGPPVRWLWLYLAALIAALSHLLLDWTNNYGVRPFFPFNPRWYAGSFVFIAEPVLWALLLMAMIMPWIFGLADSEIGARRKPFRGRGWAIFALTGMVVLWCWRWGEQAQARATLGNMQVTAAPVIRTALEPYPVNPYRWHAILETADAYQTAEVNTWTGEILSDPQRDTIYKPADTPAVEAAKQTPLGNAYLDWGRWAVVRDLGQEPVDGIPPPNLPPNRTWTTVEFGDLRFAYSFLASGQGTGRTPLGGWVYIVDGHEDAGEGMGGRQQK